MIVGLDDIEHLLADPVDLSPLHRQGSALVAESGRRYRIAHGQPILLAEVAMESGGWRFPVVTPVDPARPRPIGRVRSLVRSVKRRVRRGAGDVGAGHRLVNTLTGEKPTGSLVLIVGGATVGLGSEVLLHHQQIKVASFDIYPTPNTTFVADAHRIPLAPATVDAVWIQAVLEHVYRPHDVLGEIVRVLKPGGLVYAETPFLQPVHEGAYDYTRFTPLGHRLLFDRFSEEESGSIGGPAASAALMIRGLVGGLTRSTSLARAAYLLLQPLVLMDRLVPIGWRSDFATGCFFLGRLRSDDPQLFDAPAMYRADR